MFVLNQVGVFMNSERQVVFGTLFFLIAAVVEADGFTEQCADFFKATLSIVPKKFVLTEGTVLEVDSVEAMSTEADDLLALFVQKDNAVSFFSGLSSEQKKLLHSNKDWIQDLSNRFCSGKKIFEDVDEMAFTARDGSYKKDPLLAVSTCNMLNALQDERRCFLQCSGFSAVSLLSFLEAVAAAK